ncbi:hypothetical protein Tdes44962_MAKER06100 [Teratosphaeria destructans]|uniref:Uncharacterized protein n=1 Tax=Teratosphaeria destructans TaxID=418781 RepID=A0A9W7VY72_9PEZI|nr:hypothetical protein Tdes44962_MAKER06100 [Teratosphaeria destructans]
MLLFRFQRYLVNTPDRLVVWFMDRSPLVQWITVCFAIPPLLLIGASLNLFICHLPRLLVGRHHALNQKQSFVASSRGLDPATGIPLIPLVADPFMQRIAYAMPDQLFDWVYSTPCGPNPHPPFGYTSDSDGATALLRLRRSLSTDDVLRSWWTGVEGKVRKADDEIRDVREEIVEELGFNGFCKADENARRVLEAERKAQAEEMQALDVVKDEDIWGWSKCAWSRWSRLTDTSSGPKAHPVQPGKAVMEACNGIPDDSVSDQVEQVARAARKEQYRVLGRIQKIAEAESDDILRAIVLPAMEKCTGHWTGPTSARQCLKNVLPTLNTTSIPGVWTRPSWADDSNDFGNGAQVLVRRADTVYGVQVPSETASVEGRYVDTMSRREEVVGLQHDFLNSIITEMLALSVLDVLDSLQANCRAEVQRGRYWWTTDNDDDDDDGQYTINNLHARALSYVAKISIPFSSPRVPPKPKNRRLFFNTAIRGSTCRYMSKRSHQPTSHVVTSDAIAVPSDLLGLSEAEQQVVKQAMVAVENSFWEYWNTGPEVQWAMVWNNWFTGLSRDDPWLERIALDFGNEAPIMETRKCKRHLAGRRKERSM